ncbi:hypothetical protein [Sulfurimonas sp. HSL3-7]|uniref:hypothetical protein n=1 Tax=Sulfonitrofixus jiaomeiensis TaxID=3131938 RepID=UPI0031F8DD49
MKKTLLGLSALASLASGATNEALQQQLDQLRTEMQEMRQEQSETNEALLDEITGKDAAAAEDEYQSFSSMGVAASKVYHSRDFLSIGGYGEYEYKKYFDYKNYDSDTANATRNKSEFNIVRFVPYFGFKFNDWIVMNTEVEFEDGGARSDDTKNYKYAIVEFSYLDFLIDKAYSLRVGHILVPMGLTNLNHEPVAYLTTERPTVETLIIPSTWHTNGALLHGEIDGFEYYAGLITSPDAGAFVEGRYIQQGRLGARQFTDDFSGVVRASYSVGSGFDIGASALYGQSSILNESKPGDTLTSGNADISMVMFEAHATYNAEGFNVKTLATYGALDGDLAELRTATGEQISSKVNGQYLTVGYDLFHLLSTSQNFYLVGDIERLDMDADGVTDNPDNNRFMEYSGGFAYYPDPKVVIKADFMVRDYGSSANLADEQAATVSAGFIF